MAEDDAGQAIEDSFILDGQPYIWTDQPWEDHPEAAVDAFMETRRAYTLYWAAMHGTVVIENGVRVTYEEARARVMEFAAGMYWLMPYVPNYIRFARRVVHGMVFITAGVHLNDE